VTAQLDEGLPPGEYTVAWHVVSSDGHPIDGEFTYAVEGSAEPTDTTDAATEEPETSTQEAEPTQAPDGANEPTTATELAGVGDGAGASGLAVAGGILAAVLVVLGVVAIMRRKILENDRLRRADEPDSEEPDSEDPEKPNDNPTGKPHA